MIPRVLAVASAKGGTGKTTTALNLAVALSRCGKDVTVVDANLQNPNVGVHLGAFQVPRHVNHVLAGHHSMHDAVYQHRSGVKVVPASLQIADRQVSLQGLRQHLQQVQSDVVVLDSGSGLHEQTLHALQAADEVLLVTNPEWPALADALKTVQVLRSLRVPCRGVVLNKTGSEHDVSVRQVEELVRLPVLVSVPFDAQMRFALKQKEPLVTVDPASPAADAFIRLAEHLSGYSRAEKRKKFLGLF